MRSAYSISLAGLALMGAFVSGFSATQTAVTRSATLHQRPSIRQHADHRPVIRGGGALKAGKECPATGVVSVISSLWGTGGVLYILAKAIKRVMPIALEPFKETAIPLSTVQLGAYIATCVWFAYVEGYKGFQLKFSPMVVKRSFTLVPGQNDTKWYHFFLAPFYSMGLIHATRKRRIVSTSVSIGVAAIVAAVKRLPYPYRNIIDAGVVAGLTWGSLSMTLFYLRSWITGKVPSEVSAELPE